MSRIMRRTLLLCSTVLFWLNVVTAKRKNVLFLVSDDMRPELGAYQGRDYPTPVHPRMYTPNLDELASHSLVLRRAYVQQVRGLGGGGGVRSPNTYNNVTVCGLKCMSLWKTFVILFNYFR